MCMERVAAIDWRTPCGRLTGKKVKRFLKTLSNIIKAVAARCLYGVYTLLAVWRVTVALDDPVYWLLLFSICLIGIEAMHTIIARKGGELKWVTPSVFFYLVCAVPSIWLLELKLLKDRLQQGSSETTPATAGSPSSSDNVISIDLSDEGWTLALEQILIFVLVFGKWIAPKGELTRDELSQLLLVTLGAGADIIELLESFNEDAVRLNSELVYLVMSVWSWSLLQFCIVPTSYKELPQTETPIDPSTKDEIVSESSKSESNRNSACKNKGTSVSPAPDNGVLATKRVMPKAKVENSRRTMIRSQSEGVSSTTHNGKAKSVGTGKRPLVKGGSVESSLNRKGGKLVQTNADVTPKAPIFIPTSQKPNGFTSHASNVGKHEESGIKEEEEFEEKGAEKGDASTDRWDHAVIVIHDEEDDLKLEDTITSYLSGERCFTSFCWYNEMWGMVMSMLFQDVPFLITRLFIMFHYNVISHMTVFFTFKNVVIILLLLNRIRVVLLEERSNWKKHMNEVRQVKNRNTEILREQRRMERGKKPATNQHFKKDKNTIIHVQSMHTEAGAAENKGAGRPKKPKWLFWRT